MAKEIFVGRRVIQRDFRDALSAMVAEANNSKGFRSRKKQHDDETPFPQLFVLSGESGLGKSALLSQFVSIVRSVSDDMKKDITVITLDFDDFLFTRNVLPFTPHMLIGYLHASLLEKKLGLQAQFSEYDHIQRRIDHLREKVSAIEANEWRALVKAQGDEGATPGQPRDSALLLRYLRAEKKLPDDDLDLYENAEYRLAKALVNGLVASSSTAPVVVVLDNLDRLGSPEAGSWLRSVFLARLFDRKCRVMALVSGHDLPVRHFRNLFAEEMLSVISFENETLTTRDIDECCTAMRVNLEPQSSERVEAATGGVAIVVRDVLSIAKEGKPLDDILEKLERAMGTSTKIGVMAGHFLGASASQDKALLTHVLHLALLHECDNKVIASLWNCAFADVGNELSELSDRYPFFTGKVMHDAVRDRIREYCMRQPGGEVGEIITDFAAHTTTLFADELKRLSTAVPSIDKRYADQRYEHAFLGYVSGLLWQRRDEVKRIMAGCFCECLLYNRILAGRILGMIEEFIPVMANEDAAFYANLSSGLRAACGRMMWSRGAPPAAELSMLEMLEAAGSLLSAQQGALLHLFRADVVYRLSENENAFEDLEKCEPFAEESDLFAETLADGYLHTGEAFFGALHFEPAIKAFGRVAEIRPGRFDAWYGLGRTYAALTRHVEAEDAFIKAAALKSDRWELFSALADEQRATGKFAEAATSYQLSADLFEENKDVWHGLGRSRAALSQHAEAVQAYSRAAALTQDDAELYYEMGYSQAQLGRTDGAIGSLRKAIALRPDYWEAAALLGEQQAATGDFSEAVKAFERAAASRPEDATILNNLGKAALSAGDDAKAVEAFTKATESRPDYSEAFNNLGLACVHLDRVDEAAAAFEKAIANSADNAEAHNNLGTTFTTRNRHADALEAYTKAVRARPGFAEAWYNMGLSLHALGRFNEALEPYAKATELDPARHEAWFNQGIALHAVGRCDDAISCFAKTVELSPASFDAWLKMGLACVDVARRDEAIRAFTRAAEIKPDSEEAWHSLGATLAEAEKYDEAVAALGKAVSITPGQYEAWFIMGKAHKECGRFKEALDAYREALKAESKAEAWFGAGLCSYYLNDYEKAIELLTQADSLLPDDTDTVYTLGLSNHALGKYPEAMQRYRRTLALSPESPHARVNLALSLHASGDYAGAIEEYRLITESQPSNAEAWYNMARACEALGNTAKALSAYAKTVEIAPDKATAWLSMGNIQMSAEQYPEAIASFAKGLEKAPDNPDAWGNIALASYYTGQFQEAIDGYTKALAIRPGDAMALGSLGLTYYSMANYSKAVEASEKAVAIKPDELWIQVNLALASVLTKDLSKASPAFDAVISLAQAPTDLLPPIASLKEMIARDPELEQAREILTKLEEAWRRLKQQPE